MKIFELSAGGYFLHIDYDKNVTELMKREMPRRKGELWGTVTLKTIKGIVKKGTPLGDCPRYGATRLIVSEKLKGLIQSFADDEIEFLPVEVDGQPGYFYMNVLLILDALDLEKSEVKRFPSSGKIMYVIQAQYHDAIIDEHHIFILPNYHGVYISEGLKKHLEDNGVLGTTYRDTSVRVENPFEEVFNKPKKEKPKRGMLH